MKKITLLIIGIVLFSTSSLFGQEKSVTNFLEFASKSTNERTFILLNRWEPKGIKKEISDSGHSLSETRNYSISYGGKSYELKIGHSISVNGYDEDLDKKIDVSIFLKLAGEIEFYDWKKELIKLGVEFEEFEENNRITWMARFYNPLYRFNRIFLIKKKVNNDVEYLIQID